MTDKKKIRIDIYDADGELCETIGGRMSADEIIETMVEALRNEGIPVLREGAKAPIPDKGDNGVIINEALNKSKEAKAAMKEIAQLLKEGKPLFQPNPWPCNGSIAPQPLPLIMRWKVGDIEFNCSGAADDVLDAQDDFFDRFPENT